MRIRSYVVGLAMLVTFSVARSYIVAGGIQESLAAEEIQPSSRYDTAANSLGCVTLFHLAKLRVQDINPLFAYRDLW